MREIPIKNIYTLTVIVAYVTLSIALQRPTAEIAGNLLVGLGIAVVLFFTVRNYIGGGICKMVGACFPFFGLTGSFISFVLLTCSLGLLTYLAIRLFRRDGAGFVPMLPALAVSFLLVVPFGPLGLEIAGILNAT
ncbi:MAG: hypothetical protein AAGL24_11820 [Pseudomonadota bacterium]